MRNCGNAEICKYNLKLNFTFQPNSISHFILSFFRYAQFHNSTLWQIVNAYYLEITLNSKRRPASTGLGCIGIIETESAGIETVLPMNFHPAKINAMGWVHDK